MILGLCFYFKGTGRTLTYLSEKKRGLRVEASLKIFSIYRVIEMVSDSSALGAATVTRPSESFEIL